jgi:hypothetical protein
MAHLTDLGPNGLYHGWHVALDDDAPPSTSGEVAAQYLQAVAVILNDTPGRTVAAAIPVPGGLAVLTVG